MKLRLEVSTLCLLIVAMSWAACSSAENPPQQQKTQTTITINSVDISNIQFPTDKKAEPATTPQKSSIDLTPELKKTPILVSQLLQQYHFAKHPIDAQTAREWIESYMKMLDYNHLFFLQSDLTDFQNKFGEQLPELTAHGDISVAHEIFALFRKRLDARMDWVEKRLKKQFNFDANDFYEIDRSKVPWPKTTAEADELWERRLKFDLLQERLAAKPKEDDPIKTVSKRYQRLRRTAQDYDGEDIIQTYLSSLTELFDPHSQYMSPSTLDDFAIGMKLSLVGIGAVLTSEEGYCTIKEIIPGGPADKDKRLKINDKIIGVAQGNDAYTDIVDMKLRNAVKLIRGEKNTVVRLKIMPSNAADPSQTKEIALTRDKIELTAQQANAQIIEKKAPNGKTLKVGVIELPSFYGDIGTDNVSTDAPPARSTTEDVALLLDYLMKQGIEGLILDLRRNGGGLLDEAVSLTGLFIDQGPVVQVKDNAGKIKIRSVKNKGKVYKGHMIVLTSRNSASASEILAGALQNYGRAIIVGDKSTHGKGTVQAVVELDRFLPPQQNVNDENAKNKAGAVKLTIQKFYLPNGHSTQNRGVIPDISLPSHNDFLKIGESDSPHALSWDEINSTKFSKIQNFSKDLFAELRKRSQQRIANNSLYQLFLADIQRLRQRMEDGKISLNQEKRVQERDAEKKRREQVRELEKKLTQNDDKTVKFIIQHKEGDESSAYVAEDTSKKDKEKEKEVTKDTSKEENEDDITYTSDLHLKETIFILTDWLSLAKTSPETLTANAKQSAVVQ
ncbi:MAG: carboxy terminal-processing peptidase [Verrucomicrobiota bacterium]